MGNIDEAIERGINGECDGEFNDNRNVFRDWWVCEICGHQNTHVDLICGVCKDGKVSPEEFAKRNNCVCYGKKK